MIPPISGTVRLLLGAIASIAGIIVAITGNELSKNIVLVLTGKRPGRKPTPRDGRVWFVFLLSATITVVLGSLAAFAPVMPSDIQSFNTRTQSRLEIVDISLSDTIDWSMLSEGDTPNLNSYLDIKLRNSGDEVVYIKRIDIFVEEAHLLDLFAVCEAGGVEISEFYDIELPLDATLTPITKEISQSVAANDVDRFVLYLNKPFEEVHLDGTIYVNRFRVYQLRVKLHYNTNDEVSSDSFIIFTPSFPPGCNFFTEEWLNSETQPEKFGLTAKDTHFFQQKDEFRGKKSRLVQNLIRVAKGECFLLAMGVINQPSSMECSGNYIQMHE